MGKVKIAIYAVFAICTAVTACFLTLELFPPFQWSPPAADVLKSSNDLQRAINSIVQQNRDSIESVENIVNGDTANCPKRVELTESQNFAACAKSAVVRAEMQNADLERKLISARTSISKDTKILEKSATASDNRLFSFFDQIKRFLKWLGPTGFTSLSIAIFFGIILTRKSVWSRIDGKASFNIGGIVFDISNINAYRMALADRFTALDHEISQTYRQRVSVQNLDELFSDVKCEIDKQFKALKNIDLACVGHKATLYVPSLLQQELIQATGYIGQSICSKSSGIGRRFSVRYGIIGKSWRLRKSLYNPAVTNAKNGLIRHWGFTWAESSKIGNSNQAMISFVISSPKADTDPLGVIFMESDQQHAFGAKVAGSSNSDGLYPEDVEIGNLWTQVMRTTATNDLIKALEKLQSELHSDQKLITQIGR